MIACFRWKLAVFYVVVLSASALFEYWLFTNLWRLIS